MSSTTGHVDGAPSCPLPPPCGFPPRRSALPSPPPPDQFCYSCSPISRILTGYPILALSSRDQPLYRFHRLPLPPAPPSTAVPTCASRLCTSPSLAAAWEMRHAGLCSGGVPPRWCPLPRAPGRWHRRFAAATAAAAAAAPCSRRGRGAVAGGWRRCGRDGPAPDGRVGSRPLCLGGLRGEGEPRRHCRVAAAAVVVAVAAVEAALLGAITAAAGAPLPRRPPPCRPTRLPPSPMRCGGSGLRRCPAARLRGRPRGRPTPLSPTMTGTLPPCPWSSRRRCRRRPRPPRRCRCSPSRMTQHRRRQPPPAGRAPFPPPNAALRGGC